MLDPIRMERRVETLSLNIAAMVDQPPVSKGSEPRINIGHFVAGMQIADE
jgi:hypothetical protein